MRGDLEPAGSAGRTGRGGRRLAPRALQDRHLLSLSPGAAGTWTAPNPRPVPLTLIGVSPAGALTSPAHGNATPACGRRAGRLERPNAGGWQNSQDMAATGVDRAAVSPLGVARGWSTSAGVAINSGAVPSHAGTIRAGPLLMAAPALSAPPAGDAERGHGETIDARSGHVLAVLLVPGIRSFQAASSPSAHRRCVPVRRGGKTPQPADANQGERNQARVRRLAGSGRAG